MSCADIKMSTHNGFKTCAKERSRWEPTRLQTTAQMPVKIGTNDASTCKLPILSLAPNLYFFIPLSLQSSTFSYPSRSKPLLFQTPLASNQNLPKWHRKVSSEWPQNTIYGRGVPLTANKIAHSCSGACKNQHKRCKHVQIANTIVGGGVCPTARQVLQQADNRCLPKGIRWFPLNIDEFLKQFVGLRRESINS